jgi:hypothetical protein
VHRDTGTLSPFYFGGVEKKSPFFGALRIICMSLRQKLLHYEGKYVVFCARADKIPMQRECPYLCGPHARISWKHDDKVRTIIFGFGSQLERLHELSRNS